MSDQMPGAFPSTPSSSRGVGTSSSTRAFEQRTPTSSNFRFTPLSTMSGVKKPLYPNISHLQAKEGNELEKEFEDLGYSNTLSTKVLSELNQRAATKKPSSNNLNASVLSPRSSRYNSTHRTKFQKMESISSHYAAARRNKAKLQSATATKAMDREAIEVDKENIPSYDPYSKRTGTTDMASATKRRKTEVGVKEVRSPVKQTLSPSKGQTNLQKILNSVPPPPKEIKPLRSKQSVPSFAKPVEKKSLRSSKSVANLPRSTTTASLNKPSSAASNQSLSTTPSLKHSASSRSLSRSSTLSNLTKPTASSLSKSATSHNLTKPTASSISRSTTTNNLAQTLRTKPSQESISRIPRSKSIVNEKSQKPLWR